MAARAAVLRTSGHHFPMIQRKTFPSVGCTTINGAGSSACVPPRRSCRSRSSRSAPSPSAQRFGTGDRATKPRAAGGRTETGRDRTARKRAFLTKPNVFGRPAQQIERRRGVRISIRSRLVRTQSRPARVALTRSRSGIPARPRYRPAAARRAEPCARAPHLRAWRRRRIAATNERPARFHSVITIAKPFTSASSPN